jgi:hypothetical protein
MRAAMQGQPGDVAPIVDDFAPRRAKIAVQQIEQRRFARAIRSDDAVQMAALN